MEDVGYFDIGSGVLVVSEVANYVFE